MRPSSLPCIYHFGTRVQDYTSPDDGSARWVTKACTFICAYSPSPCLLSSIVAQPQQEPRKCCRSQQPPEIIKAATILHSRVWAHAKGNRCLKSTQPPSCLPCAPVLPALLVPPGWTLDLNKDCWTWNARLAPSMQARTLLWCLFSGEALHREERRVCIYKFVCSRGSLAKRTFSPGVSAVINGQLNVGVSLPFPTCQYVF